MSLSRRENPTPFPEGERVVTTPFESRGVVHAPNNFGCTIILDEPLKHTDRVRSSWDEVHRESDYDILEQQWHVDHAKEDVQRAQANLKLAQGDLARAKEVLAEERAELRKVKRKYDANR